MRARYGGSAGLALAIIGFGVLLLLRQAGVIDKDVRIWPIVVLALGVGLLALVFSGRRPGSGLVLPFLLLDVGIVELLKDTGNLPHDFSVWPSLLIAVGAGILLGGLAWRAAGRRWAGGEAVTKRIPVEGVEKARVEIRHGAGALRVGPGDDAGALLEGTFTGGVRDEVRREDGRIGIRLEMAGHHGWGWGPRGLRWEIRLNRQVPVELDLEGGAQEAELDLAGLLVPSLSVRTGASSTAITLPDRGATSVRISAGAARVDVRVPDGVEARIRFNAGAASRDVDRARFPESGGEFRSPGFDAAPNRADIVIEGGAGSFRVR